MKLLKKNIVIATSYLSVPGGYEKAMISTTNLLARKGWSVSLLILDKNPAAWYPVDPAVRLVHHPLNFGITKAGNTFTRKARFLLDLRSFRKILKALRPDYMVCSEYHFAVAAVLCGAGKFTRLFSWEHHHYKTQRRNSFWNILFRYAYKRLDAVICLNPDEQSFYRSLNKQAVVIPNFMEAPQYGITENGSEAKTDLLSVTRFNRIKGIDLLMETAKIVLKQRPGTKWKVIGYGEQEAEFLAFIREEGLAEQLLFQPADKTDLSTEYRGAGILVMTSRNECFPLVLLEALSNGLPCVSFDCDTGPRHIVQSGYNGLLTEKENPGLLAAAILGLLNNPAKRKELAAHAFISSAAFAPDIVYRHWEKLFHRFQ